jgi:nitroimidazol reductase NimA-like FMN-containing flavoprotein (pyridoxamine 5'-phosphate oxidase superfamily)
MIGSLTKNQSERVLLGTMIGRIGCYSAGKTYVVPITFVFDNGYIYAHSKEGLKVKMMRKNSKVCFQVDQIDNMTNWRSVILWGKFEELKSPTEQEKARMILTSGFEAFQTSESVKPEIGTLEVSPHKEEKPVFYRISIDEITGRFEKQ